MLEIALLCYHKIEASGSPNGISINFLVRKGCSSDDPAAIYYARGDEFWRKEEKYRYLDEKQHLGNVEWQSITPDRNETWLTEDLHDEFEAFIPLGNKETKRKTLTYSAIFATYSLGVATNRDEWVYDFAPDHLEQKVQI